MKAFFGGVLTAVVLAIAFYFWYGVRESEWLIMAMKNPGTMALDEIQADMNAGRYDLAKQKIDILQKSWERFSSGPDTCTGTGISDIVRTFSGLAEERDRQRWQQKIDAENSKSGFVLGG